MREVRENIRNFRWIAVDKVRHHTCEANVLDA